jgi:hypothetical protein
VKLSSMTCNFLSDNPKYSFEKYKVDGDHQCGFRSNKSTTDQIFCNLQIVEKNVTTMRHYVGYS